MYSAKTGKQIIVLKKIIPSIFLAGFTLILLSACQSQQLFQQRFLQFGTVIDITLVTTDQDNAFQLFSRIERLLIKRHTEWHGWQDGTLQQFNRELRQQTSTQPVPTGTMIPETLLQLIDDSKKYYTLTNGLFNPAMGQLIAAWGFHQQSSPEQRIIRKIKSDIPGMHNLIVKDQYAHSTNPYLQLDFGAIAKGFAVKQITELIHQNKISSFIINAGGDIFAQGQKQDKGWHIAIENPFHTDKNKNRIIGSILTTKPISIFTSGNYRRFYTDENQIKRHHIINPHSGEPSKYISAVTVLHADPVVADVAATTLMLTPISELKEMANKLEIEDFLAITEQHELYVSKSMQQKVQWSKAQLFKIHLL